MIPECWSIFHGKIVSIPQRLENTGPCAADQPVFIHMSFTGMKWWVCMAVEPCTSVLGADDTVHVKVC